RGHARNRCSSDVILAELFRCKFMEGATTCGTKLFEDRFCSIGNSSSAVRISRTFHSNQGLCPYSNAVVCKRELRGEVVIFPHCAGPVVDNAAFRILVPARTVRSVGRPL